MLAYSKAIAAGLVAWLTPVAAYLALTDHWSWRQFAASVVTGAVAFGATYMVPTDPAALAPPYQPRHQARKD
jgi:multisubunit Na+/H+ antiporter MnhE subunit